MNPTLRLALVALALIGGYALIRELPDIIGPARAAVTANNFVTPQTPNRGIVQFLQGTDSAGTYKTLYTAGANGSRCYGMWSTNNDASATHLLTVQIVNSAVKYGGMAITSVESAGFVSGTPAQNLLAAANWPGLPVDEYGNPYVQLITGDTIQATFATSITSTDLINIVTSCSDF
jgi:hypothetical protein